MPDLLLIGSSEICHQPRLVKAGDFLEQNGFKIHVFSPVTGVADLQVYKDFKESRDWIYIENNLTKKNFKTYLNWFFSSIIQIFFLFLYKIQLLDSLTFALQKTSITLQKRDHRYDLIITNVPNMLPLAVEYKRLNTNSLLIYDSQEFFEGQYEGTPELNLIKQIEQKYVKEVNFICGTTNVMCEKLIAHFRFEKERVFRIRNAPIKTPILVENNNLNVNFPLHFIWHGFRIKTFNERGINVLLKSLSQVKGEFTFSIQGNIDHAENQKLLKLVNELGLSEKVNILKPSHPDKIVPSIGFADVGLIGEIGVNENMHLTSSNKLFEFMAAGLAVVCPNLPGLTETISYYQNGYLYEEGNIDSLARVLNKIMLNPKDIQQKKEKSKRAFIDEVFWQSDYSPLLNSINKILDRPGD